MKRNLSSLEIRLQNDKKYEKLTNPMFAMQMTTGSMLNTIRWYMCK